MAYTLNYRRRLYLILLFLLILTTCASYSTDLWLQWLVVLTMLFVLVVTDFLFLGDDSFVFDPNYRSWQQATGTGEGL